MKNYKITLTNAMNGKVTEIKIVQCESFYQAVKIANKMEKDEICADVTEIN
jgi:hypothetical protein